MEDDIRLLLDAIEDIAEAYGGEYGHGGGVDWALGYGNYDPAKAQLDAYDRLREQFPKAVTE